MAKVADLGAYYPYLVLTKQQTHSHDTGSCFIYTTRSVPKSEYLHITRGWAAPEAVKRDSDIDPLSADIYSFGLIVAYIMFDGREPFKLDSINTFILEKRITDPHDGDEKLDALQDAQNTMITA